jgi:hypothetical protein
MEMLGTSLTAHPTLNLPINPQTTYLKIKLMVVTATARSKNEIEIVSDMLKPQIN